MGMPEATTRSLPPERRTRDPARTREAILATAEAEFARHGYGGGRVDRIARRARANSRATATAAGGSTASRAARARTSG